MSMCDKKYNAEKIEVSYKPISLSFEEIALLSKDEYLENIKLIPPSKNSWWLYSQGCYDTYAAYVNGESGDVYDLGNFSGLTLGVRPALKIRDCRDLIPGDKIKISEYTFTVLHGNLVLCDTCIGTSMFDYESNDFETSCIKMYLHNWATENGIIFEF